MHLNLGDGARMNLELIRASHRLAIEQRINRELAVQGLRPHQPEIREDREFLSVWRRGVDRQAARGSAVALITAEHAEIGRAEEHQQLVLVRRGLQRVMHSEARVAEVRRNLRWLQQMPESEELRAVRHRASTRRADLGDVEALAGAVTAMKELHLEQGLAMPQSTRGAEADVPVLVVTEIRQCWGQRL